MLAFAIIYIFEDAYGALTMRQVVSSREALVVLHIWKCCPLGKGKVIKYQSKPNPLSKECSLICKTSQS